MSADLHIHVADGIRTDEIFDFLGHSFGSKHFTMARVMKANRPNDLFQRIGDTPNIWIGEVSWLKAAIFDAAEDYVPMTISAINDIIGEDLPVLDDELIRRIMGAFDVPNQTGYRLCDPFEVKAFLHEHKGKSVFTVSW